MEAFFGIVYVAVMLSFIYLTRNLTDGKYIVWLILMLLGMRYLRILYRYAHRQA